MKPIRIAILIWCAIALLGLLCLLLPEQLTIGTVTLRWTTIAKVLGEKPTPVVVSDSLAMWEDTDTLEVADTAVCEPVVPTVSTESAALEKKPKIEIPRVDTIGSTSTPSNAYLARFLAALDEADERTVRVVHYGDSQIEEDRMTMTLRRALQARYGGGGVGLIPLHQTIPTRTLSQTLTVNGKRQTTRQGLPRNLVYGPKAQRRKDGLYGMMGQVATVGHCDSTESVRDSLSFAVSPMGKKLYSESYFSRIRIWADGDFSYAVQGKNTLSKTQETMLLLSDSTTRCTLGMIGCGMVYGVSLETDRGVIVDNVPMRGSIGTVFMDIDSTQLADFYRETNTRLIIMQFGGNAIPHNEKPGTIQGVVNSLRRQIRYLRACAPEADILFVGPGDMCTLIDGQMTTYPLLPYMDSLLRRMAAQEQIAYFSLYQAMGGKDSMLRWQKNGWAGSDGVHFTRRGAEIAGEKLVSFISGN